MKVAFKKQLSDKDLEIRRLKAELASVRLDAAAMRRNWMQVFEDTEKEHAKELREKDRELKAMGGAGA
jgi:phosphate uptake regulator